MQLKYAWINEPFAKLYKKLLPTGSNIENGRQQTTIVQNVWLKNLRITSDLGIYIILRTFATLPVTTATGWESFKAQELYAVIHTYQKIRPCTVWTICKHKSIWIRSNHCIFKTHHSSVLHCTYIWHYCVLLEAMVWFPFDVERRGIWWCKQTVCSIRWDLATWHRSLQQVALKQWLFFACFEIKSFYKLNICLKHRIGIAMTRV